MLVRFEWYKDTWVDAWAGTVRAHIVFSFFSSSVAPEMTRRFFVCVCSFQGVKCRMCRAVMYGGMEETYGIRVLYSGLESRRYMGLSSCQFLLFSPTVSAY